ncbi:protein of unassigned function [Methylobacterium oryzae CBMB20]|uniref:Protein of unassigned function n=1 Tax=Methylobacterium oryzae CBMB20 TaxID=693986 RepID=A0A089QAM7_9HYPH|nr:protein of unassigned function [Methylobacterium oryzae CBMB20]
MVITSVRRCSVVALVASVGCFAADGRIYVRETVSTPAGGGE